MPPNILAAEVPQTLQSWIDADRKWMLDERLSLHKKSYRTGFLSVECLLEILQHILINPAISTTEHPFFVRSSVNTGLFNANIPIFRPAPPTNTNVSNSSLSFINNQNIDFILLFFIRNGWFNLLLWRNNHFENIDSPSGELIWTIESSTISAFEKAIECVIKRLDINKNYFYNNSYFYIHYPQFSLFNATLSSKKDFTKKFFNFINDKIEFLDHCCIKYPPTARTILELSWSGLHAFIPCRKNVLHRFIPELGLEQSLCSLLNDRGNSKALTKIVQKMLIAKTDQAATSIGETNYPLKVDFSSLITALENYLKMYEGQLPEPKSIRFEGWFNTRLFRMLLEKNGYSQEEGVVPSRVNTLDPWVDFIMQRNSV